jgi:hypothetical protein
MRCGSISIWTLHRARLGQKFNIRKRSTDHEERVASFDGILRGLGSKQANTTCCIRAIVRNSGFAEQRLHDRCAENFGNLFELVSCMQRASPCEDGDLLATIQDVYGVFKSTCAGR